MQTKHINYISLVLLIIIHSADMLLTQYFIGNNWELESFPIMSLTIKYFGGDVALWISRVIMYSYFYLIILYKDNTYFSYFNILMTSLYWTAMIQWLFFLGLLKWSYFMG